MKVCNIKKKEEFKNRLDALMLSIISKLPDGELNDNQWRRHQLKGAFQSLFLNLDNNLFEDTERYSAVVFGEVILALANTDPDFKITLTLLGEIDEFAKSQIANQHSR